MEVKLRLGNYEQILSGRAIKTYLLHGCLFCYWEYNSFRADCDQIGRRERMRGYPTSHTSRYQKLKSVPLVYAFSVIYYQLSQAPARCFFVSLKKLQTVRFNRNCKPGLIKSEMGILAHGSYHARSAEENKGQSVVYRGCPAYQRGSPKVKFSRAKSRLVRGQHLTPPVSGINITFKINAEYCFCQVFVRKCFGTYDDKLTARISGKT